MKKHKFTWFDGLIALIVVALIAGTCVKFLLLDKTTVSKPTEEVHYTVTIRCVRQYTVDALQVGDTLFESEGKGAIGVISDIEVAQNEYAVACYDGTVKTGGQENRYDVILHITADGTVANGHYEIGTYDIYNNLQTAFFTKYSTWSGYVSSLN